MKETVFERWLRICDDSKCFIIWHFADVYAIPPHVRPQLFARVLSCWSKYECTLPLFVPKPFVFAYYSNLAFDLRAEGLIMRIAPSKFCVCVLTPFWLSALVEGLSGCSDYLADVEHLATRGILLPLPAGVQEFVGAIGIFP